MMMRKTGQEGTRESKVKSKHSYIFHAGVNESIWGRVIQFALIVFNSAQQMCLSKINHLHLVANTHTTKHTRRQCLGATRIYNWIWLLCGSPCCCCCCSCCCCSCFDAVCPSWQVDNRWPTGNWQTPESTQFIFISLIDLFRLTLIHTHVNTHTNTRTHVYTQRDSVSGCLPIHAWVCAAW